MGMIAKDVRLFVDQYELSQYFNKLKPHGECDALDSSTFGASGARSYNAGLKKGMLDVEGFFSASTTGNPAPQIDDDLAAWLTGGVNHVVTANFGGPAQNATAILLNAFQTKYEVSTPIGQLSLATASFQSVYGYEVGYAVMPRQAVTAAINFASVNNAPGATNNGGVGHLHVTAVSGTGGPSAVFKIQHSVDNSTWVDLIVFTTVAAPTSQRVELAPGTQVNQYVRAQVFSVSGTTPSFTAALAFARR